MSLSLLNWNKNVIEKKAWNLWSINEKGKSKDYSINLNKILKTLKTTI